MPTSSPSRIEIQLSLTGAEQYALLASMSGLIVRVEALRLERKKDGTPFILFCQMEYQTTVLPYTIIALPTAGVSLVHMDVVYALAGSEVKVPILLFFRPPTLAKRKYRGVRIRETQAYCVVYHFAQIVVCAGLISRKRFHCAAAYQAPSYVILSQSAGHAFELR